MARTTIVALLRVAAGAFLVLLAALPAPALFIRPDLANIPVAQLTKSLEAMVEKQPKNVELRFNLARLHAMAYALKTDTAKVWRDKEERGAWFGYTPKAVPFEFKKATTKEEAEEARKHLEKALGYYEQVIMAKPDHLAARLGHAWLVDKSGKKEQAVKEYREIIEKAWATEGKRKTGPLGGNFITAEAAGYLIPLLDKQRDAAEIQQLQERIAHLKKLPRPITPIAVPLADGLTAGQLHDPEARVRFDADGSGLPREWTWIRPNAAWLVYDRHGSGKVTSALQMFGGVTFWLFWENGYQPLAALDDNADGELTGDELNGLALWHDRNGNGISEPGEVRPVRDWGIVKLSCREVTASAPAGCAAFAPAGVSFRDGTVRPTYDLILRSR